MSRGWNLPGRVAPRVVPPAAAVVVLLFAWWAVVHVFEVRAFLAPDPVDVARAMVEHRSQLAAAAGRTIVATLLGFLLAAGLGIAAGSVLGLSSLLERALAPLALLFQMVPLVAVTPLFVVWFGFGPRSVIASAALVAVFPVLASTLAGVRAVDPGMRELFDLHGASRLKRWWSLELPGAIPSIVTGLRIAAGLAVIGAITAEFMGGFGAERAPLGIVIVGAMKSYRTDLMFAAIIVASTVGFTLFGIVSVAGRLLLRRRTPDAVA